ncbi:hypothetical protein IV102_31950 [bacterium]|nr:hypothetical protein [bacterium]
MSGSKTDFRLTLTWKAIAMAIPLLALAAYLASTGMSVMHRFHPQDPARWMFGVPPMILAAVLVILIAATPRLFCRGRLTLDPLGLHFDRGKGRTVQHFPWKNLLVNAPSHEQQLLRRLLITNLEVTGRQERLALYDLFVPDFDQLTAAVATYKHRYGRAHDAVIRLD